MKLLCNISNDLYLITNFRCTHINPNTNSHFSPKYYANGHI